MSTVDDGSSTNNPIAPVPVSWQTVFWILVALAATTMTQPAGRVCDLPSRHRTYLRSSPILCLADAAALVLTVVFLMLHHRASPRVCLDMVIRRRYGDVVGAADSAEGIQALEGLTLVRCTLFILGPFPLAVKLLCMANLPWSRAYAVMFLVAFVGIEWLAFVARREDATTGYTSPGQRPDSSPLDLASGQVRLISRVVLAGALIVHIGLLLWALSDIWPAPSKLPYLLERLILEILWLYTILCFAYMQYFLVILIIIGVPAGVVWFVDRIWPSPYERPASKLLSLYLDFLNEKNGWAWIGAPISLAFLGLSWKLYLPDIIPLKWIGIDYGLVTGVIAGPVVMTLAVYKVSKRWKGVGRKLLVVMEETDGVDTWACCGLVFFLVNLTVCTLWYSYGYNPEGTVNPGWTGVFG